MTDYDKLITERARDMKPSGIRRFFDLVAEMPECISLGVGEPDFVTPWPIRQAAIDNLEAGHTKYTSNAGMKELRQQICAWLKRKYHLSYDISDILVTVGGSEAIDLAVRALVSDGDEVLICEPSYVSYNPLTTLTGGVAIPVKAKAENDFKVTAEQIKEKLSDRTKLIIMNYPNNPTGAVLEHEDLAAIADVLKERNVIVLSDEIYSELTYGGRTHESIASFPGMADKTIVVNGFSKAFSMTGWRLGYAAGPKEIISVMTKIHQSAIMCAATTSQAAGILAMRDCDDAILQMHDEYERRRQYCVRKLNAMGLHTFEPKGAFYVFPDITSSGMTSDEFCNTLLKEQQVAIIPGTAFGESGEGFARISYAYSLQHLQEAMRRIEAFLQDHRK